MKSLYPAAFRHPSAFSGSLAESAKGHPKMSSPASGEGAPARAGGSKPWLAAMRHRRQSTNFGKTPPAGCVFPFFDDSNRFVRVLGNRRRAKGGRSPSLSGNGGRISGESGGMAASIALSHPTETGKSLANAHFFRQLGVPVQLSFRRPFKLG
jgi:hypothetical protein